MDHRTKYKKLNDKTSRLNNLKNIFSCSSGKQLFPKQNI